MKTRLLVAPILLLSFAQTADAHLRLMSHETRSGDNQKPGPCGGIDVRSTDKVYIAKPGTEVTFIIDEYIPHPGFFRIDVDLDGQDNLLTPVLPCLDQTDEVACFDRTNTGPYMVNNIQNGSGIFNHVYTLPDVECDNCTIQIVQAMTDKAPYTVDGNEMYHQCIDIVLANDGPDVLTLVGGAPAVDAGPNDPDPADAGAGNAGGDAGQTGRAPASGGCQSSSSTGGVLFLLLAMAFWWRRPRASVQEK